MAESEREQTAVGLSLQFDVTMSPADLEVLGLDRLQRIGNVGPKTQEFLIGQLAAPPHPLAIKERPRMAQVAALCDNPGQIPLQAATFWRFWPHQNAPSGTRVTVQDAVDDTALFRRWAPDTDRQSAIKYADAFWATKENQQ